MPRRGKRTERIGPVIREVVRFYQPIAMTLMNRQEINYMKLNKSAVKTILAIIAVASVFYVGVGVVKAQQVISYRCAMDGSVAQSTSQFAPRCPQCGGMMTRMY